MNHHTEQYQKSADRKIPQYALIERSRTGDWILLPHRFYARSSAIDFAKSMIESHDNCASSAIILIYRLTFGAVVSNLRGTIVTDVSPY